MGLTRNVLQLGAKFYATEKYLIRTFLLIWHLKICITNLDHDPIPILFSQTVALMNAVGKLTDLNVKC